MIQREGAGVLSGSWPWFILLLFALLVPHIEAYIPGLIVWPTSWVVPLSDWINNGMEVFADSVKPFTRLFSDWLEWPMLFLRDVLQWLPWPVLVLGTGLIALHASGWRMATLCVLALLYIVISGYWRQAMNTMALVGIAVPLSLLLGLIFGIIAQRTRWGARVIPPVLDVMQTMPTFAYLIPLLVLFGFGPVVGLIASAIYACPPMVRNVHLGLACVDPEIREAAEITGASPMQKLFWVELPAAMQQIKVGINQTIMAALSMVIIASVIGGFDDIGWEVLNTMRKARFGDSLMAGLVIVLLAVVIDRISSAYAGKDKQSIKSDSTRNTFSNRFWIAAVTTLVFMCVVIKALGVDIAVTDPAWANSFSKSVDGTLEGLVATYGNFLTEVKNNFFYYYLLPMRVGFSQSILPFTWGFDFTQEMRWGYALACTLLVLLVSWWRNWQTGVAVAFLSYFLYFGTTGMSWLVFVLFAVLLAWQIGGVVLAVFVGASLTFILTTGMWEKAMLSVYLCSAAALLSFLFGSILGIWASASDRVSSFLRPIADTFQTIPLFVFLIPVLMFFQIGEFTALLAIIAYAFVPALRYSENALRQVSPQLIEVAVEQGCTRWQIFWQVKLPLAMPTLLVGLNQTIMYAFAMLVIAALVGTTGLGQQIYLSLSAADTGQGIIAGLSMALLAMMADRLLQSWAAVRFRGS